MADTCVLSKEFLDLFDRHSNERKHTIKTRQKELTHVRVMCEHMGKDFLSLDEEDILDYLGYLKGKMNNGGLSPRTVRDKVTVLSSIGRKAVEDGLWEDNPFEKREMIVTSDEPCSLRIPSVLDCDRVLSSLDEESDLFLIFVLALRMAFCTSDICRLKKEWISTDKNGMMSVSLPPEKGYPFGRCVLVPDDVAVYLCRKLDSSGEGYVFLNSRGRQLSPHRLEDYVRKALSMVALDGGPYSLKDFRNRAVCQMLSDGADSREVGYYAGIKERRLHTLVHAPLTTSSALHSSPAQYSRIRVLATSTDMTYGRA